MIGRQTTDRFMVYGRKLGCFGGLVNWEWYIGLDIALTNIGRL